MKKNMIFACVIVLLLLLLFGVSLIVMYINDDFGYKFNNNIKKKDLVNLYIDNDYLSIEDNYMYIANSWDENTSTIIKIDYDNNGNIIYGKYKDFDRLYNTALDVGIGDHYKKVLAYYGIKDGYAYWNVEMKNKDVFFYNYPSDIIRDKNISNAYLTFLYYLEDGKWKLLHPNRFKNKSGEVVSGLEEYFLFRFEFGFNDYSKNIKDETVGAYSICHYKKES